MTSDVMPSYSEWLAASRALESVRIAHANEGFTARARPNGGLEARVDARLAIELAEGELSAQELCELHCKIRECFRAVNEKSVRGQVNDFLRSLS